MGRYHVMLLRTQPPEVCGIRCVQGLLETTPLSSHGSFDGQFVRSFWEEASTVLVQYCTYVVQWSIEYYYTGALAD